MIAHQRLIRDKRAQEDRDFEKRKHRECAAYTVSEIGIKDAAKIIYQYEWLGTMPSVSRAAYGLFHSGELCGAVVFGTGHGSVANNVCGKEYNRNCIALERGACTHLVHRHAPSLFVNAATEQAHRDHGWTIFYAYSDVEAGEIGTIYQACNWLYIGQSVGRNSRFRTRYINPNGEKISSRAWRRLRDSENQDWSYFEAQGWRKDRQPEKHKYVHFEGDKRMRKKLLKALRYPIRPYPKRKGSGVNHEYHFESRENQRQKSGASVRRESQEATPCERFPN